MRYLTRDIQNVRLFGIRFLIDEAIEEVWNTGKNQCVIDFIVWYYRQERINKRRRGLSKITEEDFVKLIDPEGIFNIREEGISADMLKPFLDKY